MQCIVIVYKKYPWVKDIFAHSWQKHSIGARLPWLLQIALVITVHIFSVDLLHRNTTVNLHCFILWAPVVFWPFNGTSAGFQRPPHPRGPGSVVCDAPAAYLAAYRVPKAGDEETAGAEDGRPVPPFPTPSSTPLQRGDRKSNPRGVGSYVPVRPVWNATAKAASVGKGCFPTTGAFVKGSPLPSLIESEQQVLRSYFSHIKNSHITIDFSLLLDLQTG